MKQFVILDDCNIFYKSIPKVRSSLFIVYQTLD